jgi:hypothetical protein
LAYTGLSPFGVFLILRTVRCTRGAYAAGLRKEAGGVQVEDFESESWIGLIAS